MFPKGITGNAYLLGALVHPTIGCNNNKIIMHNRSSGTYIGASAFCHVRTARAWHHSRLGE